MYNTSFVKKIFLAVIAVFLYSCDKDFNALGDGLVGDDHFGLESEKYDVVAFNQEVTPIQSNNLATNALGIYDDPVFGTTTANFVTQIGLETYAPTIGESPVIESVTLSIPYFNTLKTTNTDGSHTYELDSIYGDKNGKLKLSIYESKMQMRNSYFNNGSQLPQFYYTDQSTDFFNAMGPNPKRLNNGGALENDEFFFSSEEITVKTTDPDTKVETVDRSVPAMTLSLDKDFFQDKILDAVASKLSTEDIFQEYFRGLYFNVERSGSSPANMALIDFSGGKIIIKYKAKTAITTDADSTTEDKTITLLLKSGYSTGVASTASFLQTVRKPDYESAITTNVNKTEGDERLYLKGGQGSLSVIRLTDFASQLETIRASNWKVNEANLVFTIDADKMTGLVEPNRVYLYDLTNNTPLVDYYSDGTSNTLQPGLSKYVFGGIINLDSNKRGKTYKIRITDHVRNLIKDATAKNVDLGLVVSQSINVSASNVLKLKNETISQAPRASVMSPLGTILYGSKASVAEDKRVRLEVYYTKPN
ncbi:DUF4270 domain-containing protein [Flavobacterium ginsenosidimutans]|uniref:DUF4270 domain-containing protein n=1 Tax=Flavobacterium ginsenosidimutans TaxID=687844 RepID=A0ABZ2QCG8_9FLAO